MAFRRRRRRIRSRSRSRRVFSGRRKGGRRRGLRMRIGYRM